MQAFTGETIGPRQPRGQGQGGVGRSASPSSTKREIVHLVSGLIKCMSQVVEHGLLRSPPPQATGRARLQTNDGEILEVRSLYKSPALSARLNTRNCSNRLPDASRRDSNCTHSSSSRGMPLRAIDRDFCMPYSDAPVISDPCWLKIVPAIRRANWVEVHP